MGEPAPLVPKELLEGRAPPIFVGAMIAWALTVAPVGFAKGASFAPGLSAVLAVAAGLAGPFLLARRPRVARHVGISLFVALSTLTWLGNGAAIHPLRLEPLRGAFGALAWGVFALAWSERWGPRAEVAPPDPEAPALLARSTLPPLAVPIAAGGIAAGLVFLVLAFRIRDPDRALVAQALALACSVAVVTSAATVATTRGKPRSSAGRRITAPIARSLLLLVLFAVAGALVTIFR